MKLYFKLILVLILFGLFEKVESAPFMGISAKAYQVRSGEKSGFGLSPTLLIKPMSTFGLVVGFQDNKLKGGAGTEFKSTFFYFGSRLLVSKNLALVLAAASKQTEVIDSNPLSNAYGSVSSYGVFTGLSSHYVSASGFMFGIEWLSIYVPITMKVGTYRYEGVLASEADISKVRKSLTAADRSTQFSFFLPQFGIYF